jgi:hypothetical protein
MAEQTEVRLVEVYEQVISIQKNDATLFDHLVKIDEGKLEHFKQIQRDFMKMQNELRSLIG